MFVVSLTSCSSSVCYLLLPSFLVTKHHFFMLGAEGAKGQKEQGFAFGFVFYFFTGWEIEVH